MFKFVSKKLCRDLAFFGFAGTAGFLVDTVILYLLKEQLGSYWARAISFLCAVFVTWLLNRNTTFRDNARDTGALSEFLHYAGIMMAGGVVNYAAYAISISLIPSVYAEPIFGVMIGSLAGMGVNFLQLRLILYRRKE
ncbi:MAG: GtrA family protein [Advenella sp.]|uniref:GtrA family protein n=1 Tax=Advenella sp. TaxID=1872388 RepID=UPI003F96F93C